MKFKFNKWPEMAVYLPQKKWETKFLIPILSSNWGLTIEDMKGK